MHSKWGIQWRFHESREVKKSTTTAVVVFYEAPVTISGQSSAVKAQIRRLPDFCSSSFVCSQPNRHLHQTVNNQQWPRKQRPTSSSCFSTTSHTRLLTPRSFNSILASHRPQPTILSLFLHRSIIGPVPAKLRDFILHQLPRLRAKLLRGFSFLLPLQPTLSSTHSTSSIASSGTPSPSR